MGGLGCLFACFSISKYRRRRRLLVNAIPPNHHQTNEEAIQSAVPTAAEKQHLQIIPINLLQVSVEKLEVEGKETFKCNDEKVCFDLNGKTLGELTITTDDIDNLLNKDEEDENQKEEETKSSISDLAAATNSASLLDLEEKMDLDIFDNGGSNNFILEESSESLFSLSIESRKQVVQVESGDDDKEVTSPVLIHKSAARLTQEDLELGLVLTSVENFGQRRKVVKVKASSTTLHSQQQQQLGKENMDVGETSFISPKVVVIGQNNMKGTTVAAVDTSLSSWLVESESESECETVHFSGSHSVGNSFPKKRVLGGLAAEDLKQRSVQVVSPSQDETTLSVVIGTIGSYWSHTGQAVDSDSISSSPSLNKEASNLSWNERTHRGCECEMEAKLEATLDNTICLVRLSTLLFCIDSVSVNTDLFFQ